MCDYLYHREYPELDAFEELVRQTRKQLLAIHNPCTILIYCQIAAHEYPCYIDFLNDGIEVLAFPDDTAFCQSILHSANEEPDLLFTNAISLTCLYHSLPKEPNVYAIDECNRCLVYESGYLPKQPLPQQLQLMKQILSCLQHYFQHYQTLPSNCGKALRIHTDGTISYMEKEIEDACTSILAPKDELLIFQQMPRTQEHLSLSLLAYPNPKMLTSNRLDIHIVACADTYQKEMPITIFPQRQLLSQLYDFLFDLFQAHGIPQTVHFQNMNLANMTLPFLTQINVAEKEAEANPLLDLFLSTFAHTAPIQS